MEVPAEAVSSSQIPVERPPLTAAAHTIDRASLIDSLRQAVACQTESVDSLLKAVAAAAQVLTGANGIAVALRQDGRIVCRARSGDMAPELGAIIDPDSGISGECVRAAAILMCHDTFTDKRVDAEVCRQMGIRSIVAVPLRGDLGMAGVLEAFSSRPNAFDSEALNSLRALSQIAEAAYARDRCETAEAAPLRVKTRARSTQIVVDDVIGRQHLTGSSGRVWIIATIAMALLTFSVAWWSWRHTSEEVESSIQAVHSMTASTTSEKVPQAILPKPTPTTPALGYGSRQNRIRPKKLLKKAAEFETAQLPLVSPAQSSSPQRPEDSEGGKGTD